MRHWFHRVEAQKIDGSYYFVSKCLTCLNKVVWKKLG